METKSSVKYKKQNPAMHKTVIYFGGVMNFTRALKVHHPNVSKWLYGEQPIPLKHAIQIEYLTKGEIKASELRPDVFKEPL